MEDDQQFCLRWNNHQSTLVSVFDTLLEKGIHVDCTLAAEGQTLKAHKVVLSACSPYFESVLSQQYDKHPIIILKDVKYAELRAMMDYMYRGEVNISQDQLAALLKAAESLQIKGLSDNKPSRPPSRPAPAAHPPRAPSPPPKLRDGSIDSREGSVSPTRRRKKARRNSTDVATAPLLPPPTTDSAAGNGDEHCKKEEGMEDLTLDEEHDEPAVTNNDIVRNFQWHMERSQDEIMNSSDSVRDSQDLPRSIMTRSMKAEPVPTATTFAILKPRKITNTQPEEAKENKKLPPPPPLVKSPVVSPSEVKPVIQPKVESPPYNKSVGGARVGITPLKEKSYICQNCHRGYNARRNLVRHVTVECGRVPQYKCPHCEYRQHRRNELRKHIEKKHPNKLPATPTNTAAAVH